MENQNSARQDSFWRTFLQYLLGFLPLFSAFFLVEVLAYFLFKPSIITGFGFGFFWACMLSFFILCLPRTAGRIIFGILYYIILLWTLAQSGYYSVFGKLMWVSTVGLAGEGATFLSDVISAFPLIWWLGLVIMLAFGIILIWKFPRVSGNLFWRAACLLAGGISIVGLCLYPRLVFRLDKEVWGAYTEYAQSSSYRAAYTTMFDAKRVYDITGIYQLSFRDIWVNEIYPLTPKYKAMLAQQKDVIDDYFSKRSQKNENEMTGIFANKNVIMVLMESMDDWMITESDTPTIHKMMQEGINFTNFYTPWFGSARTLNSEFCMNTGIYLPTTGKFVFDYVNNDFNQSIASQLTVNGYNSLVFHYNDPSFYSRGVFEPAMGYERYVCYADYTTEKKDLYNENFLFDHQQINSLFFRDGLTFNTIITRSAHLGYTYNETLSYVALLNYPRYKGLYVSEEEDCARVKAKLVDDFFARLLQELEDRGQLENTVIIAMSDHYTYGYKNMEELYAHSGVTEDLLLEKTPCFVWSVDCPDVQVTKTLNTSDFLPTMLNLLGINSPYSYLGQDAFDPTYAGFALFPDGSWIRDGVAWQNGKILMNVQNRSVTQEEILAMSELSEKYREISNLLLTSNYYQ